MKYLDKIGHIILYIGFLLGALAIYELRFDSTGQFLVVLTLSAYYLIWGVVYHYIKGDMDQKLMVEYLLISCIAAGAGYLVFKI